MIVAQLFLKNDPGETKDLAKRESRRLNKMASTLRSLHGEVQREGPEWPAWNWARYESKRIEWPPYREGDPDLRPPGG